MPPRVLDYYPSDRLAIGWRDILQSPAGLVAGLLVGVAVSALYFSPLSIAPAMNILLGKLIIGTGMLIPSRWFGGGVLASIPVGVLMGFYALVAQGGWCC